MDTNMSDISSCTSNTSLLSTFWPDLFSRNRQLNADIPTALQQTTVTQYHMSNQMFSLPCVGRKLSLAAGRNEEADRDMMDVDTIMEDLFDFTKYASETEKEEGAELHPRDSASNRVAKLTEVPKNAARGTVGEAKIWQPRRDAVKTLQPFEQLKKSEEFVCEGYNAQQRQRTKMWLDGIPSNHLPSVEWAC
jgi:hypothetical protein